MPRNAVSPDELLPVLHLETFGQVAGRVVRPGDAAAQLGPGKPLALLVYLACAPERAATREHLASLLWSTEEPGHARQALRQLILRLRQQLGGDVIEATRDLARLVAPCEIDRQRFLHAVGAGDLAAAVHEYRGPFLPDLSFPGGREFDDWVAIERASLSRQFQLVGQRLVRQLLDAGRARDAVAVSRRLRDDAPYEESAWRPLLEAALAVDDPITAAVEATTLERMLADFDTEPSPSMRALLARCRNAPLPPSPVPSGVVAELVGREQEFAAVLSRWDDVRRQRRGRSVLVEGASGLGKTRLLNDIARRLSAGGARVVSIGSSEADATVPWTALARVAQGLATLPGARGVAPESARQLVALHPALSSVFAVASAAEVTSPDPGGEAARVRALAVVDLLEAVSDERAVAVLIDDLHWWDARSLAALGVIAATVASQAVLLIGAARRAEDVPALSARTEIIILQPLTREALEALLASIAVPVSSAWAHEVSLALQAGSGGNPLLALEALEGALGRGILRLEDGTWRSSDTAQLLHSMRRGDALQARVQALDAEERWVVLLLAVAAQPLTTRLLLDASAREAPVLDAMERLARKGIVVPATEGLRVAHDLLAARVLEQTPPPLLRQAHLSLGRSLAGTADTSAGVRRALVHFLRADALGEAAAVVTTYWTRTGGMYRWRTLDALLDELFDGLPAVETHVDGTVPYRAAVRARLPRRLRLVRWRFPIAGAVASLLCALVLLLWRERVPPLPTLVLGVAAGDSVRLIRVAVDTTSRADRRPLDLASGTAIATLGPRGAIAGFPRRGPGAAGIALHRFSGDSGGFDVYRVDTLGALTRLTATPGDDIDPAWSPDGRFIVFQTARWSRSDEAHANIAVLDLRTGSVRPLTTGRHRDRQPRWSADGMRIVFFRRVDGVRSPDSASAICWTTPRGDPLTCHPSRVDAGGNLHGWVDASHVLVADNRARKTLRRHDIDTGAEADVAAPGFSLLDASPPDGWGFGWRDAYQQDWLVGSLDGRHWRPLVAAGDTIEFAAWASPVSGTRGIRSIRWPGAASVQPVGVPLAPSLLGGAGDSAIATVPPGIVRWSSVSPFVEIERDGRGFRALRPGTYALIADAGGWVRDTFTVRFAATQTALLFDEHWRDRELIAWRRYGDPAVAVRTADTVAALHVAGDGTFVSGAVTRVGWPATQGLAVEFVVSTPITRDVWQRLHLLLVTEPRIVIGGVSGMPVCAWRFPAREEAEAHRRAGVVLRVDSAAFAPAPGPRADRRWYLVRLQWFPDGRCGVAIDGRVVARGGLGEPPIGPVHVAIEGQSVGTDIAVRRVRVWRGIPEGVAW